MAFPATQQSQRIRPIWRVTLAVLSVAIAFITLLGEQMTLAIRSYYFKDQSPWVPSLTDALAAVAIFYLLLVAATGRWRLFARRH